IACRLPGGMHAPARILAENFNGLWVIILALPVGLIVLAGVSFAGSARGHWSGPAIAAPAIGLGILLFVSVALGRGPCVVLALALAPTVVGILSIGLWAERRKRD